MRNDLPFLHYQLVAEELCLGLSEVKLKSSMATVYYLIARVSILGIRALTSGALWQFLGEDDITLEQVNTSPCEFRPERQRTESPAATAAAIALR